MKRKTLIITALISGFVYTLYSCQPKAPGEQMGDHTAMQDTSAKRGGYLVTIMGCNDCHTPKIMGPNGPALDTSRILSGYVADVPLVAPDLKVVPPGTVIMGPGLSFTGPWGTSVSANLTSDATGIGNWSESQFRKAFQHGKYMGVDEERMLLPPMPWENYKDVSDADVKAIFAYLKSTRPVKNMVPAFIPPGKQAK